MKTAMRYKGLQSGPVGNRLASTRFQRPQIAHAPRGSVQRITAPRIPIQRLPSPLSLLGRPINRTRNIIKSAKASQSLDIETERVAMVEQRMKELGLLDEETSSIEGGL